MKTNNKIQNIKWGLLALLAACTTACAVERGEADLAGSYAEREKDEVELDDETAPRVALRSIALFPEAPSSVEADSEVLQFQTDDSEVTRIQAEFDPAIAESGRIGAEWKEALK